MAIEDELRERLRKVEALFFGATTAGEREAAGAATGRLKAKLAEASRLDPPVEMKFTIRLHARVRPSAAFDPVIAGELVDTEEVGGVKRHALQIFISAISRHQIRSGG